MKELTEKQRKMLAFITEYICKEGQAPSYQEVADFYMVSVTAAYETVNALVKKGALIRKDERSVRGIFLPKEQKDKMFNVGIPLFGKEPLPEDIKLMCNEDFLFAEAALVEERKCLAFRVTSESMIDAAILPGDLAIISQNCETKDDDIVLAFCKGGERKSELRRIRYIPGFTLLVPDNASMGTTKTTEAMIIGKLIAVRRNYNG